MLGTHWNKSSSELLCELCSGTAASREASVNGEPLPRIRSPAPFIRLLSSPSDLRGLPLFFLFAYAHFFLIFRIFPGLWTLPPVQLLDNSLLSLVSARTHFVVAMQNVREVCCQLFSHLCSVICGHLCSYLCSQLLRSLPHG